MMAASGGRRGPNARQDAPALQGGTATVRNPIHLSSLTSSNRRRSIDFTGSFGPVEVPNLPWPVAIPAGMLTIPSGGT